VGLIEARGGAYAVVIAVFEQHEESYMGSTAITMTRSLTDLGYRVVDTIKAGGLWVEGEAAENQELLRSARKAGEKLVNILQLRKELEALLKSSIDDT
jgi:hypothetical protein